MNGPQFQMEDIVGLYRNTRWHYDEESQMTQRGCLPVVAAVNAAKGEDGPALPIIDNQWIF